jgi:protein-S-isoprenylcysteine O-methyltransferase Ste14
MTSTHDAPPTSSPAPSRSSAVVAIGNALFHYRNGLFPIVFILVALVSRPILFGGNHHTDWAMDAVGLSIALAGQTLRAAVIGLAYIVRGGKNRRIYADTLVTEGFFAHSRNPLYVGNMLVYLGLFIVLNSTLGYAVGVPLFLFAYWCITLAEEDFLRNQFGHEFDAYCQRVPRYVPRFSGLGATLRGMEFDWKRLIRKEYGSTFSWMTAALALLYWESVRNRGVAASTTVLAWVVASWLLVVVGYLTARYLKKANRLQST